MSNSKTNTKKAKAAKKAKAVKNFFSWDVQESDVKVNIGGKDVVVPNRKALIRDDNNMVLAFMAGSYEVLSNQELTMVGQLIADDQGSSNVNTFTAKQGRRVCAQIELPQNITIGDDTVTEYLTLMNGHDGKGAFSIGFSNKVMSCANQYFAFKKLQKFSVWHNSQMSNNIDVILKEVEQIKAQRLTLNRKLEVFADTNLVNPKDEAVKLVKYLSGVDLMIDEKRLNEEFKLSKAAITKANKMLDVTVSEMDQKGQTIWGLFNGATYYANHHISSKEPVGNLVYGRGATINAQAMKYCTELL